MTVDSEGAKAPLFFTLPSVRFERAALGLIRWARVYTVTDRRFLFDRNHYNFFYLNLRHYFFPNCVTAQRIPIDAPIAPRNA